jgi:hypothetical protein
MSGDVPTTPTTLRSNHTKLTIPTIVFEDVRTLRTRIAVFDLDRRPREPLWRCPIVSDDISFHYLSVCTCILIMPQQYLDCGSPEGDP